MRAIIIFFGLSFLLFFGTQFGLNYAFPPYQSIASEFFDSIAAKEYKQAYHLLSSDFKSKIDFQHFEDFIDNSDYKNYRNGRWFNAELGSETGTLQGVITLKSFRQIPLSFSFVKERETRLPNLPMGVSEEVKASLGPFMTWKIQEIRKTPAADKL